MGYIYCLTSPSGKMYIGQTKRSVEKRIKEHIKCDGNCILLERAITKYGISNFKIETLIQVNDELLDNYEIRLIDLYNTQEPHGYNIKSGGNIGSSYSINSRERMRQSKLGEKNHNYGIPRTLEAKQNISLSKSGINHHFYGKQLSLEHKLKLSKSHKSNELPMYMVYVKERPHMYQYEGYAIVNHPILKNKYFTSKHLSIEEKYKKAYDYLNSCDMNAVQRLNGSGCLINSNA